MLLKFSPFNLAFFNKKWRYCHDPAVLGFGVGIGGTNFNQEHIAVITKDIYLKFGTYIH